MTDIVRQEIAATATTMVVKVGTRVLTSGTGSLNYERIGELAQELHDVMSTKRKVVLVPKAVGSGHGAGWGLRERPTELAQLQAVAAAGQSLLVEAYERSSSKDTAAMPPRSSRSRPRSRSPQTLFERPQHALCPAGIRCSADHQRERHDQRGRAPDDLRRQRPAGGDRHKPDPPPLLVLLSDVEGLGDGDPAPRAPRKSSPRWNGSARDSRTGPRCEVGPRQGGMASKLSVRMATVSGET